MTNEQPPPPDALSFEPGSVPDTLRERDTWVCWRYEFQPDRDKWTKVPRDAERGGNADPTGPETWTDFETALAFHKRDDTDTDGLGFVVRDGDTVAGLDLDDVRDPDTGDLEPWAADVLDRVDTYTEVSPSGTGLRLFGLGFVPDGGTRSDVEGAEGHVEMYDSARYLTVTGHRIDGSPADVRQVNDAIHSVHAELIADPKPDPESPKPAGDGGVEADSSDTNPGVPTGNPGFVDLSDAELLEKARNAENGDKFRRLYDRGDWSGYDSHSEARQALANLLVFWTGDDKRRMLDLFQQSALFRDEKADNDTRTFWEYETENAIRDATEFYDPDHTDEGDANADTESWEYVQRLLDDDDIRKTIPRAHAVNILDGDHHFRAAMDTEELYRYDPEAGIYRDDGGQFVGAILDHSLGEQYSTRDRSEIVARLKDRNWTDRREFGASPGDPRVCVANGVLDLDTGELDAHSPDEVFIRQIPVEYDPDADCPAFDGFLGDVVGKDDAKRTIYEFLGLAIHPGYPVAAFLMLYGDGRNGKSTLIEVIEAFLGTENVSNRTLQALAEDDFAAADLYGKLANIGGDLPADALHATGKLKTLTGGDHVTANPKHKQPYSFRNEAALIFSANDPPRIEDDSTALARRLVLVNCPNEFTPEGTPGPDARPRQALLSDLTTDAELSGILTRAVDGIRRVKADGRFSAQGEVEAVRERYKRASDPVYAFAGVAVRDDSDGFVTNDDLYACYVAWCDENDAPKKDKNVLTRHLGKHVRFENTQRRQAGGRVRGKSGIELTSRGHELLGDDRDDHQTGLGHGG